MSRLANKVRSEISSLTQLLTERNLSIDSRLAQIKIRGRICEVGWDKEGANIAFLLKDISYDEYYRYMYENQQYNLILPDGALIQLLYRFDRETLSEQRVCYFPPPKNQDSDPESNYDETPLIRIDYNPSQTKLYSHSATHLHLGYTKDCRIPTSAPIAPQTFVLFILQSFYSDKLKPELESILLKSRCFPESILKKEKKIAHFAVPSS